MKGKEPPHIKIENPGKPWSVCWLDQGQEYCPICKKGKRPDFSPTNGVDCVKKYALESAEKLIKNNNIKGHGENGT